MSNVKLGVVGALLSQRASAAAEVITPYFDSGIALIVVVGIALLLRPLRQLWRCKNDDHAVSTTRMSKPLPPGRLGLPIVGETLAFLRRQKENKLWQFVEDRAAKHGEVFKTSLIGDPTVVIASPAGNKLVFTNENKLVNMAWPASTVSILGPRSVVSTTGDRAKRIRDAITTFLRPETLQTYVAKTSRSVVRFIDESWEGREHVLVHPSMRRFLFSLACELFMSCYDRAEQKKLEEQFASLVRGLMSLPINLPGTRYRKAMGAASTLRDTFQKWMDERRQDIARGRSSAQEDLLSCLLTFEDREGKPLSDGEIKDNIVTMLFAAHDTSTSAITMVFKFLGENPGILEEVWKENKEVAELRKKRAGEAELNWSDIQRMKLSWRVVQETLRLEPPAQGGWRIAVKEIEAGGFRIPKGWKLHWSAHATHRNPKYFENPDKFDPRRFEGSGQVPYTFVPFGGGARMCPGNEFARMEVLLLLHHLSLRFKWTLVDPIEAMTVEPTPKPTRGLPICLQSRPHD